MDEAASAAARSVFLKVMVLVLMRKRKELLRIVLCTDRANS